MNMNMVKIESQSDKRYCGDKWAIWLLAPNNMWPLDLLQAVAHWSPTPLNINMADFIIDLP